MQFCNKKKETGFCIYATVLLRFLPCGIVIDWLDVRFFVCVMQLISNIFADLHRIQTTTSADYRLIQIGALLSNFETLIVRRYGVTHPHTCKIDSLRGFFCPGSLAKLPTKTKLFCCIWRDCFESRVAAYPPVCYSLWLVPRHVVDVIPLSYVRALVYR